MKKINNFSLEKENEKWVCKDHMLNSTGVGETPEEAIKYLRMYLGHQGDILKQREEELSSIKDSLLKEQNNYVSSVHSIMPSIEPMISYKDSCLHLLSLFGEKTDPSIILKFICEIWESNGIREDDNFIYFNTLGIGFNHKIIESIQKNANLKLFYTIYFDRQISLTEFAFYKPTKNKLCKNQ